MGKGKRRITGPAHGPGVHTTAPVTRLQAQSAVVLGHPVIVMIQPDTVTITAESGELLSADTVETSMKAAGGQTMSLPPNFTGEPAKGWEGSLNPATDEMLLRFPSGALLYDGTMPTTPDWVAQVRVAESVVVLTGPMATLDDFEPLLMRGRVLWTRVPLVIS